ncbi:E3 ubiquitin-protein ligase RNF149 [Hondaea fermentalgiana]|uniref:E3 ubiquitin-protein ligase RNF149 n=1 Tax=Hondaea fermentalgiana TaxID=2315210 RepID=A0A2R5G0Q7_9STRA|nr:E3 ubiquitin-protein ligase RNF149 [Hondaea fermentalgiana]|eukprot:GBG23879.1 E3 ubiquitin-protein ligase RNF149 [Hondaea fermentalgiana]
MPAGRSNSGASGAPANVVLRPEDLVFGSEVGTMSWSWNPQARLQSSNMLASGEQNGGEENAAAADTGAVDPALEVHFYERADEGQRRKRNMFTLCFAPEGQLVAQLVVFVAAIVSTATVLSIFGTGGVASLVLCIVMVFAMSLDLLRSLTLVAVRRLAYAPSECLLSAILVNSYLSGCIGASCVLAFVLAAVSHAPLQVTLLFLVECLVFLLCFGWYYAVVSILQPLSAGLFFPIWLVLVPLKYILNFRTERPEPEPTVIVTQADVDESMPSSEFDSAAPASECAICIVDFEVGDPVRTLPCKHTFHRECIDPWFLSNHTTCPSCRAPFRDEAEAQDEKPVAVDTDTDTDAESDGLRRHESEESGSEDSGSEQEGTTDENEDIEAQTTRPASSGDADEVVVVVRADDAAADSAVAADSAIAADSAVTADSAIAADSTATASATTEVASSSPAQASS